MIDLHQSYSFDFDPTISIKRKPALEMFKQFSLTL